MQIFSPFRFLAVTASLLLVILSFSCAGAPMPVPGPEDERGVPADAPEPPTPAEELPPQEGSPLPEGLLPSEGLPPPIELPPPEGPPLPEGLLPPELPPAPPPPEKPLPETPAENTVLMGKGLTDHAVLSAFLLSNNPGIDMSFAEELSVLYREESAVEGINHDIAFAQMCLETGFLRYGGLVTPEMNNFCGLGAINADSPGESFSNPRIGVRAHIQHLKAYATTDGLNQELVDPRYFWVRYGSAPTIDNLTGAWAADREYGIKLRKILGRLYSFNKQAGN